MIYQAKHFFRNDEITVDDQILETLSCHQKKSRILITEINQRIARKVCRRESVFKFFENLKAIKVKITLFDSDKNDFNINDCNERLFNLIFV